MMKMLTYRQMVGWTLAIYRLDLFLINTIVCAGIISNDFIDRFNVEIL